MIRKDKILTSALVFLFGIFSSHSAIEILKIYMREREKEIEIHPKKQKTVQREKDGVMPNFTDPENLSFLWEKGIFGREQKKEEEKKEEIKEVVISPLSATYKLMGTIVGNGDKIAFISPHGARGAGPGNTGIMVKKLGEQIEPGAVISEIKNDRIEIIRGDRKEILFLFDADEKKFAESALREAESALREEGVSQPQNYVDEYRIVGKMGDRPDLIQIGEDTYEVKREFVQANFSDMGNLLVSARAIPYIKDGAIQGFRLVNISPSSFYRIIGLQDGDVIKSVNNIPISNPQVLLKIMSDIQNETYFEIKIDRMGREKTLRYHIR